MDIKKVKRFFSPIIEIKKLTMVLILYSAYLSFFWIYSVEILKKVTQAIEIKDLERVYFLTTMFVLFIFSMSLVKWSWRKIFPTFYWESKNYIQNKYIKEFILFENNAYEKIWTWKLIALIERWIDTWRSLLTNFFYFWLQIIFSFIFSIFYIYKIIGNYTLVILFIVLFLFIVTKLVNIKAITERVKMVDYWNLYTKDLVKVIMSKFEILQNNKIEKENSKLKYLNDMRTHYFIRRAFWIEMNFGMNLLFTNLLKVWAILIVWVWVIKWTYGFSDFLAIITILTLLDKNVEKAVDYYKDFTKEYVKVEKFYELFDNTSRIEWYERWKNFVYKTWNYKIKDLSFSYPWKQIFNNFTLNIVWWKKTAIIWKSGSWKTTLIKILSWFLKANSWQILIDNQDLNNIKLKSYYKHIWYLTQEPSIFDGSIIDNLTYWSRKKPSEKEIKKVLKKAEADFVFDFKDWVNTEIGERWIRLSWWQRQRLAIAKIFIKNPEIIILDEPTSSLDSFSEEAVTAAVNNLFIWRTVIIIAHRLQTVKEADEIIILDEFKIIERWTHKELLKTWKYYKKMVALQSWLLLDS